MGLKDSLIKPIRYLLFIISFQVNGPWSYLGPINDYYIFRLGVKLGVGPSRSLTWLLDPNIWDKPKRLELNLI